MEMELELGLQVFDPACDIPSLTFTSHLPTNIPCPSQLLAWFPPSLPSQPATNN